MSATKLDISELKLANVEIKYDDEKEEILISSKINPKFKLAVVLYNEGFIQVYPSKGTKIEKHKTKLGEDIANWISFSNEEY